jgi:hypothetical protein
MQQKHQCLGVKAPVVAIVDQFYDSSKSVSEYRHMMVQYYSRRRSIGLVESEELPKRSSKKAKVCNKSAESSPSDQPPAQHLPASFLEQGKCQQSFIQQGISQNTKKESPSGMSINWHQRYQTNATLTRTVDNFEVTIGATGLKRGKKPKQPKDVVKSASILCRYNFFCRWRRCLELSSQNIGCCVKDVKKASLYASTLRELLDNPTSYMESKQKLSDLGLVHVPESLFGKSEDGHTGPLGSWVRNGVRDDFGSIFQWTNTL